MLCVLSNILGGCIRLHFNCDSEVPAVGTGYTSIGIRCKCNITEYIGNKIAADGNLAFTYEL